MIPETNIGVPLVDWMHCICGVSATPEPNCEPGLSSRAVDGRLRIRIVGHVARRKTFESIGNAWASWHELAILITGAAADPSIRGVDLLIEDSRSANFHGYDRVELAIRECWRSRKKVRTYIEGDCFGGAFLVALATSSITCASRSRVGMLSMSDTTADLCLVSGMASVCADMLNELRPKTPAEIRERILAGDILSAEQAEAAKLLRIGRVRR
ncbi:MAG: hypothetical protein HY287_00625 [Planctomycetes bacterium]|nr:hypothetical protein [Planctomycetota bacterium]